MSLDFAEICRLCGKSGELTYVFEEKDLRNKIFMCVGVKIQRKDEITQQICKSCYFLINTVYEFRLSSQKHDTDLRKAYLLARSLAPDEDVVKEKIPITYPSEETSISQESFLTTFNSKHKNHHSSVLNLKRKFPLVNIPKDWCELNIDPKVQLDLREYNNYVSKKVKTTEDLGICSTRARSNHETSYNSDVNDVSKPKNKKKLPPRRKREAQMQKANINIRGVKKILPRKVREEENDHDESYYSPEETSISQESLLTTFNSKHKNHHSSVLNLKRKFPLVNIPKDWCELNIDPKVQLDLSEYNNYVSKKVKTTEDFGICSTRARSNHETSYNSDVNEVSKPKNKKQLSPRRKREAQMQKANINIRGVKKILPRKVREEENDHDESYYSPEETSISQESLLTTFNSKHKNHHSSVLNLKRKFPLVNIPKDWCELNIDPKVQLDLSEYNNYVSKKVKTTEDFGICSTRARSNHETSYNSDVNEVSKPKNKKQLSPRRKREAQMQKANINIRGVKKILPRKVREEENDHDESYYSPEETLISQESFLTTFNSKHKNHHSSVLNLKRKFPLVNIPKDWCELDIDPKVQLDLREYNNYVSKKVKTTEDLGICSTRARSNHETSYNSDVNDVSKPKNKKKLPPRRKREAQMQKANINIRGVRKVREEENDHDESYYSPEETSISQESLLTTFNSKHKNHHSSVLNLKRKFPLVNIPKDWCELNIDPKVRLDLSEYNNYVSKKVKTTEDLGICSTRARSNHETSYNSDVNEVSKPKNKKKLPPHRKREAQMQKANINIRGVKKILPRKVREEENDHDESHYISSESNSMSIHSTLEQDRNVLNNLLHTDAHLNDSSDSSSLVGPKGDFNNLLITVGEEVKTYICQTCNQVLDTQSALTIHKKFKHRPSSRCRKCSQSYNIVENLMKHKIFARKRTGGIPREPTVHDNESEPKIEIEQKTDCDAYVISSDDDDDDDIYLFIGVKL